MAERDARSRWILTFDSDWRDAPLDALGAPVTPSFGGTATTYDVESDQDAEALLAAQIAALDGAAYHPALTAEMDVIDLAKDTSAFLLGDRVILITPSRAPRVLGLPGGTPSYFG